MMPEQAGRDAGGLTVTPTKRAALLLRGSAITAPQGRAPMQLPIGVDAGLHPALLANEGAGARASPSSIKDNRTTSIVIASSAACLP